MKLMILLSLLLTGCLNNDDGEVSSGGQQIDPEIIPAYLLVADIYDFSGIRRIYFADVGDDAWMRYDGVNSAIKVNRDYYFNYTDRENGCALVHELAHHNGADQAEAFKAGDECLRVI